LNEDYNLPVKLSLDVGTTKICAIISTPDLNTKKVKILGIGIAESQGLNRGVVVNIDKTVNAIKEAVGKASQQAGVQANKVVAGIAGDHIEIIQKNHIITITNPEQEIQQNDVDRLISEAAKIQIQPGRKILHIFPQEYIVDDQDGILEPIGMSGTRLEAKILITTGMTTAIDNIHKCIERAGLEVEDLILEPLASSYAVLEEDEKEVGVALIDIGGGTTDIAVFIDNVIRFTRVIALGGNQLTDDIRKVLNIVKAEAERIKRNFGYCYLKTLHKNDILQIPGIAGRSPSQVPLSDLTAILQARMSEILKFVDTALIDSGVKDHLGAGVVITGGSTLLEGTVDLASDILHLPARLGIPNKISSTGLAQEVENPMFSTAVGLAIYGFRDYFENPQITDTIKKTQLNTKSNETHYQPEEKMKESEISSNPKKIESDVDDVDIDTKIKEKKTKQEIKEEKEIKKRESKEKRKSFFESIKEFFKQF
jgi:cell division protein FtsA